MPSQVLSIGDFRRPLQQATWSLLEIERPGHRPEPLGVLLVDAASGDLALRVRPGSDFDELEEQAADILDLLPGDLRQKARELGGHGLLASLEDALSGIFRLGDRTAIAYSGDPQRTVDKLFDQHVDSTVRPFVTHLPLYALRAAATKFGEARAVEEECWVRVPESLRLGEDMFAAWVVGRSMEPLIPDGSLCAFRFDVTGSRQGRRLLIEKFDENDFASRYTVKRYTSEKIQQGEDEWSHKTIRLEPLNPEFEAFELAPDAFRVIAEFVEVLES